MEQFGNIPEKNEQKNNTEESFEKLKNLQEVFELNPELLEIGTKEQYSEYLETIFPDSNVKDILFHTTKADFEKFDKEYISRGNVSFGEGFYFTDKIENHKDFRGGNKMMAVIVNLKNVYRDSAEQKNQRELPKHNPYVNSHERLLEVKKSHNDFLENNYDGVIATYNDKNEFVVFDPENIHILGAKSDIESFKDFVSK